MSFTLPDAANVVVRDLLITNAARWPDEIFVTFDDGTAWTRAQALELACRAANTLRSGGVEQGDGVAIMLPNGPEFLRAWWGAAMLGATVIPVNTAFRGRFLENLLRLGTPKVMVAAGADLDLLRIAAVAACAPAGRVGVDELDSGDTGIPELVRPIRLSDPSALVMTSGTTGPSKMAVSSYLHIYLGGSWFVAEHGRGREDTYMIDLPLFHGSGFWFTTACLATGTKIAMRSKPALQSYWEVVRDHGVTMGLLLSTMVPFLLQQPQRKAEREHGMRAMSATPLPRDLDAFMTRFNLAEVWGAYGLTEVPTPIVQRAGDAVSPTYCGQVRQGFECRLVDENDIEVPHGTPGELVVRSEQPWMLTTGYNNNPGATAASWRNGWFHTGDMMRLEDGKRFHFVDRAKDAVRRRGENVSSMEVEAELREFPGVANIACVPHRDQDSVEDEVKVWVLADERADVDFAELLKFAAARLPYFMVPRYFELAAEFPMTHSMRVKKVELRTLGNSERTWDREAHGYQVTRNGLLSPERTATAHT